MKRDRLIVALDFTAGAPALAMARALKGLVRTVKVGSALFTACGPDVVRRLRMLGFQVMLDLKFFDIPSTVELSCRAAAGLRVSRLTVHAAGDRRMLEAAVRGARAGTRRRGASSPKVLAVTVLTSTPAPATVRRGQRRVGGGQPEVTQRVIRLARQALEAGCDGVVASAQEAAPLRRALRRPFELVCPGIRPLPASRGDQHRVGTPAEALASGADLLVIGRPITGARDPRAAARQLLNEMEDRHAC